MNVRGARVQGVAWSAGFFACAGLLEIGLAWATPAATPRFWRLWDALGRGGLDILLAFGLAHRVALCRTVALVYCLASLTTYAIVLALALGHAPFAYPTAVVIQSVFEVPSCALLFGYLRSPAASAVFTRPLL
jgi:hypothetical protein